MPAITVSPGRAAARPAGRTARRKSPLRVVNELPPFTFDDEPGVDSSAARAEVERSAELTAAQLRRLMISEFRDWLRSRTNRQGRPFQADTVSAYADAAIALDAWMTAERIEGDFTACDTALLNRFFAAYFAAHGQGGTNTKQRNLRHLFSWLEREHDHPHPYTDDLQRYTPAKNRPSTLAGQFITDLLKVTGNGRARSFEDARDHAMIRMLTEGVRRTELVQQRGTDRAAGPGDGPGDRGICLPVLVLGMGSALAHLLRSDASAASAADDDTDRVRSATRLNENGPCGPRELRDRDGDQCRRHPLREPARLRLAEAYAAAERLIGSGQRVSRRSLRSAGLRGSNADLGLLAHLVRSGGAGTSLPVHKRAISR